MKYGDKCPSGLLFGQSCFKDKICNSCPISAKCEESEQEMENAYKAHLKKNPVTPSKSAPTYRNEFTITFSWRGKDGNYKKCAYPVTKMLNDGISKITQTFFEEESDDTFSVEYTPVNITPKNIENCKPSKKPDFYPTFSKGEWLIESKLRANRERLAALQLSIKKHIDNKLEIPSELLAEYLELIK